VRTGSVKSREEQKRLWGYVNDQWNSHPNNRVPPTPEEAIKGFKILYRAATGRTFKGVVKITSGNRHTWSRQHGVWTLNPNESNSFFGGWREIVHSMSHYFHAVNNRHLAPHHPKQAYLERKLTEVALRRGFLDGKLKPKPKAEKPPVDELAVAMERLEAREKAWATKQKRATNAIARLKKERKSLERKLAKRDMA
jgi:hypothetical protein